MNRIFGPHVYGPSPRVDCWWDETCGLPDVPSLAEDLSCDVAIIGAGFTGLNAALELARHGADVVVLDALHPGWGASGRNGGFCCLGGSKLSDDQIDGRFGKEARLEWRATEKAAVGHVVGFLDDAGVDADRHSQGETWLAHRPKALRGLDAEARSVEENYGVTPQIHSAEDLVDRGMSAGFFGGMTIPIGCALNPRKYVGALLRTALSANVRVYSGALIDGLQQVGGQWVARSTSFQIRAAQVIVATNGYSSETVPKWLGARYMPVQSSVVVSRPLTDAELSTQGWTSDQMCYDSRNLLHYFHLLPDRRMLFGLRGGLGGTMRSDKAAWSRARRDFDRMFPAWTHVELTHQWSGMVCMTRDFAPFVGAIPGQPGLFGAFGYHGNGVAMGSYSGRMAGQLVNSGADSDIPHIMQIAPRKYPLGRARRALMYPSYAALGLADRI